MGLTTGFSQDKTRKELKEGKKFEKQKQVEAMVNAKEFVFVPQIALPSRMRPVNLSPNQNYVKFQPDLIDSNMPFFGNGYSGLVYSSDTGLHFKGKPNKFTIEENKKTFQIDLFVNGETDNFRFSLQIDFEGSAIMTITSNKRSAISFQGEVYGPEKIENSEDR
jgi:hypothetical protein